MPGRGVATAVSETLHFQVVARQPTVDVPGARDMLILFEYPVAPVELIAGPGLDPPADGDCPYQTLFEGGSV